MKADIKMEDVVRVTEVSMDMTMENTLKPKAGHAKGTASVNFRGIKLSSDMEHLSGTRGRRIRDLQQYGWELES